MIDIAKVHRHAARALSLGWAKSGVVVNVVAPCITETESRKVSDMVVGHVLMVDGGWIIH
jgi:hypothetical protein